MGNLKDIWNNNMTSTDRWLGSISIVLLIIGIVSSGLYNFLIKHPIVDWISLGSFTLSFAFFFIQLIFGNIVVKSSTEQIEKDYTSLRMEIDRFVKDSGALGKLKEITEAQIWDLDGDIYGFNPNWDLELTTNFYGVHDEIRKIHYRRLENPNVKAIEYIFLEGYEHNGMLFGSTRFLNFLDDMKESYPFINNYIYKYIIWCIPKEKWENDGPINELIAPFKDLIFIRGTRFSKQRVIVFFNNSTSIVNGTHDYYLELYGDNQFSQALVKMFEKLKVVLCDDACKCPYPKKENTSSEESTDKAVECADKTVECQKVYWDDVKKSHQLIKRKK